VLKGILGTVGRAVVGMTPLGRGLLLVEAGAAALVSMQQGTEQGEELESLSPLKFKGREWGPLLATLSEARQIEVARESLAMCPDIDPEYPGAPPLEVVLLAAMHRQCEEDKKF